MSTADQPDALARRIERLAAALPEGTVEAPCEAESVAPLVEALRTELRALRAELGARLDGVEERLSGVATGLDALTATVERLDAAVGGFRTEWPTRTYEVVQGARAVAEGVVLDVRAEIGARLDDVRTTLERVVGTVDLARAGLHDGTDRLASAGAVLAGERVPERRVEPEPVVAPDREPEQGAAPAAAAEPAAARVAARPPAARRTTSGAGGTVVVPGPGRAAKPAAQPSARRTGRTVAAPGRGRLVAMPQAPDVDVALDAAASHDDDRR